MVRMLVLTPLILLTFGQFSCGKKSEFFEGQIDYAVSVVNDPEGKYKTILPTKYSLFMQPNRVRFYVEGGIISSLFGGMIFDGLEKKAYMLMKSSRLAYVLPQEGENALDQEANKIHSKVEAFEDSIEISGYWCKKYLIESEEDGQRMKNELWITKKLKSKYPSNLTKYLPALFHHSIEGMPLKVVSFSSSGREIHLDATGILNESISSSHFEVPDEFTKTDDDPTAMILMMKKMMN
jgi:Domain of unknown function (DUF4412)